MEHHLDNNHAYVGYNLAAVAVVIALVGLCVTLFGIPPTWVSAAILVFLSLWVVAIGFLTETDIRQKLNKQLVSPNYTHLYTYLITRAVSKVWEGHCNPIKEKTNWWSVFQAALTLRLFDRALLIAVAYPMFFLFGQWAITGQGGSLSAFSIFPHIEPFNANKMVNFVFSGLVIFIILRWALIIFVKFTTSGLIMERIIDQITLKLSSLKALVVFGIAFSLFFCGVVYFIFNVASGFSVSLENADALQGPLMVVMILLCALSLSSSGTGAFTLTAILALIVISSSFLFSLIFILILSVSSLGLIGREASVLNLGKPVIWHGAIGYSALLSSAILILICLIFYYTDWTMVSEPRRSTFVFLTLLPLCNALFDLISYALTLSIIRFNLNSPRPWLWGFVDLGLACILFLSLGATLVVVVHGLNVMAGVPLIDLQAVFGGVYDRPSDYVWLYLMLFSTILPTGIHAMIALISLQGWCPLLLRARLGSLVINASKGPLYAICASLGLALVWTVFVSSSLGLIWIAVHFGWGFLLAMMQWYFDLLLWLAEVPVGAI